MTTTTKTPAKRTPSKTAEKAQAAGARVPADRAAKAEALDEAVSVSYDGFEFVVERDAFDDYELLDALSKGIPGPMLDAIAGDQKEAVIEHVRDENGRVRITAIMEFITGVMQNVGAGN